MLNAWRTGLVIFCLVAGGWILVQGRAPGAESALPGELVAQASAQAGEVASALGLGADSGQEPGAFYHYTDATGTIRFVRSLDEVPLAFRASAGEVSKDRVQHA